MAGVFVRLPNAPFAHACPPLTNDSPTRSLSQEDIEKMLIRAAYLVRKFNVPLELLLNLDETPLW